MSIEQLDTGILVSEIIVCLYEILCGFVLISSVLKTKDNLKKKILWEDLGPFHNEAINGNLKMQ